ncbi:MAG: molybdopterin-dependent oxidoreductase [Candidatus Methanofastidiosa archaeon]|nr:molybdopterin-dependent oxidoreductase [Candidatus Methanofastidiosa archaeon]
MDRNITLLCLIVGMLCIAGCITGGDEVSVTLDGESSAVLTLSDIKALPAVEGYGGRKNSVGQITLPMHYKGVPVTALYELDHAIAGDSAFRIGATDGYLATFSYNQFVNGMFVVYDEEGNEIPAGELTLILAYEENGKKIPEEYGGPLRLAVIGPEAPITDGHWWIRFVSTFEAVNIEQ